MAFVITADSVPITDKWGFGAYWNCADWIQWHKLRKAKYGLQQANYDFVTAFENQEFLASGINCRSLDSQFRQYASDNGFLDALFTGIGGLLATPIGTGTDVVNAGSSVISNAASGLQTFSKYLPYIIGVIIVLTLLAIISIGFSKTKKLSK